MCTILSELFTKMLQIALNGDLTVSSIKVNVWLFNPAKTILATNLHVPNTKALMALVLV